MATVVVVSIEEVSELVRVAVREELARSRESEREVLTADDVAAMLSVHVKTVAKLVTRDGLPARRLGREYRFDREEVLAWLAERAVRPGAHTAHHLAALKRNKAA